MERGVGTSPVHDMRIARHQPAADLMTGDMTGDGTDATRGGGGASWAYVDGQWTRFGRPGARVRRRHPFQSVPRRRAPRE